MQSGTYVLLLAFVAIASTTASVLPLVREAPWHVQRPNITLSRMYRTKIDEQCYHGDLPLVAGCNISVFICEVASGSFIRAGLKLMTLQEWWLAMPRHHLDLSLSQEISPMLPLRREMPSTGCC